MGTLKLSDGTILENKHLTTAWAPEEGEGA